MHPNLLILFNNSASEKVFGIPLIRRLVLLAQKTGISNIYCIYLPGTEENRTIIADLIPDDHFMPLTEIIRNGGNIPESLKDNTDLVYLKGNTVIDKLSLERLVSCTLDEPVVLVDPDNRANSAWILKLPGRLTSRPQLLRQLVTSTVSSNKIPCSLFEEISFHYASPGLPFLVTDKPESIEKAENRLINSLGLQTAQTDGFMAKNFDRHISRFFSKRLVRTGLHPNWFTVMGMSIGLVGAWLLSLPGYLARLLGALLFVFCIMVDGVDGEIARLTLKDSTFGHYFDIVTDNIVHAAIFIALPVSFYRETGNSTYLKSLWFLLLGVAFAAFSAYYCIFRVEERHNKKIIIIFDKLASRDFAYLLAILALIDRLEWFLWGATFGSYVFGIVLWVIYLRSSPLTRDWKEV